MARAEPLRDPLRSQSIVSKAAVQASQFVENDPAFLRLAHQRCIAFLGHVRAATHGDPADNQNNHPFTSEDGNYHLVHNGIVPNHEEIADKFGLRLTSQCDSELLLRLVEKSESPQLGLRWCLKENHGSMAVAMYDATTATVLLARNSGRPLWLARLENDRCWWFASTAEIIHEAFHSVLGKMVPFDYFLPVPENTPVVITWFGQVWASHGLVLEY